MAENGGRNRLAVHSWNDHGYGESYATVRVYVVGALVWEAAQVRLDPGDLWCAATLDWPSGRVEPCTDAAGGRWITPDYQHPLFEPHPCGEWCRAPYPACAVVDGVATCVPCTVDAHCPDGQRCDLETYDCE
jgi:Cys-rich repeat protein